jgi:hypothetical protein
MNTSRSFFGLSFGPTTIRRWGHAMEEALHRLQSRGAEDDGRNALSRFMPSQTRHERAVRPWSICAGNLRPVDSEVRLAQLGRLRGVTPGVFGPHRTDSSNPIWVAGCPERPFGQNDCAALRWSDVKDQLLQYRSGVPHVCRASLLALMTVPI